MSTYTYGPPQRGKTLATSPAKRTCQANGCSTTLSIYNAAQYCWVHESASPRRGLSPKR
jgi:hypothetical protein